MQLNLIVSANIIRVTKESLQIFCLRDSVNILFSGGRVGKLSSAAELVVPRRKVELGKESGSDSSGIVLKDLLISLRM